MEGFDLEVRVGVDLRAPGPPSPKLGRKGLPCSFFLFCSGGPMNILGLGTCLVNMGCILRDPTPKTRPEIHGAAVIYRKKLYTWQYTMKKMWTVLSLETY